MQPRIIDRGSLPNGSSSEFVHKHGNRLHQSTEHTTKSSNDVSCFMGYTLQKTVSGEFDPVVESTISALKDEGFGILCDIDVQATFAEKLDTEFRQCRILGACNPGLAHEGLSEELELGASFRATLSSTKLTAVVSLRARLTRSNSSASPITMHLIPSQPKSIIDSSASSQASLTISERNRRCDS